jgi:hypothetical protein
MAIKETVAWQVQQAMETEKITKVEMAKRMKTRRAALDRLLDPGNGAVTLQTLSRAANAIGRGLRIELVKIRAPSAGCADSAPVSCHRSIPPVWAYTAKKIDGYMPLAYSFSVQTVVETPMYLRAAEAIYSEANWEEIVRAIAAYPETGDLIPGTGGTASCALHVQAWENAAAHESFICTAVRICRSSSSPCMPNRRRAI